jgi:hypothetical protein
MRSRRAPPRPSRGFRLSKAALEKLERTAAEFGWTQSELLEALVMGSKLELTAYYAHQAAVEAFVAASMIVALSTKAFPAAQVKAIRDVAAVMAEERYGPQPAGSPGSDPFARVREDFEEFARCIGD